MAERGFSLMETLVALAVFSIGAVGLMQATTQSAIAGGAMETRVLARAVAENVATDTLTSRTAALAPSLQGEETQRRRNYIWTRTIEKTPRDGLYAVTIEVREKDSTAVQARLAFLTRGSQQ